MVGISTQRLAGSSGLQRWIVAHRDIVGVYAVLILMGLMASVLSPQFLTPFNIQHVLAGSAALALVSIGQTFVILTGGIDLSVGSTMSLITVVASLYMNGNDGLLLLGVLLCVAIGAGVGLINGLVITVLRVEPIIATLGMMSVVQGLTFMQTMTPSGAAPPTLQGLIYSTIGPVPQPLIVMAVGFAVALFILRKTRFGMHVYALGGAEESARRSGVHTVRIKVSVYVISGIFAALAGLLLSARLGMGDPLSGQVFMLSSIAAVAIGGASLFGGRGGLAGTFAGVLILGMLSNLLTLAGVETYPQRLITGLLIIAVVGFYSVNYARLRRLRMKGRR